MEDSHRMVNEGPSAPKPRRGRGPTRCLNIHNMPPEEKIAVQIDEMARPVGRSAAQLMNWCGTIARDGCILPLHRTSWHKVEETAKEQAWADVKVKFEVKDELKQYILQSIGKKWKDYKCHLKKKFYDICTTNDERYAARPHDVLEQQWISLIQFWNSEEGNRRSAKNKQSRSKQTMMHTAGTKSFARLQHEQRHLSAGTPLSRVEMFIQTHVRKDGSPVNTDAAEKMKLMKELMEQQPEGSQDNIANPEDIFTKVMGPERDGRVRGCGLGPTPKSYFGASSNHFGQSNSDAAERIKLLEEQLQQKDEIMKQMQHSLDENNNEMSRFRAMMEHFSGQVIEKGGSDLRASQTQPSDK